MIINQLQNGAVGVIPTDTIYGIVGSALIPETVEQIYTLRKRSSDKPMIILISSLNDLNHFNIKLTKKQLRFLQNLWPNPVSVVLPVVGEKWKYLHRGINSLAFRIPNNQKLSEILSKTGPLVAPSANPQGEKVSETIKEAKRYFGNQIAFYVDGGKIIAKPSTLIELSDKLVKVLRQGEFNLPSSS